MTIQIEFGLIYKEVPDIPHLNKTTDQLTVEYEEAFVRSLREELDIDCRCELRYNGVTHHYCFSFAFDNDEDQLIFQLRYL